MPEEIIFSLRQVQTCTMVEDKEGFYRCYFTADDGEKAVENLFRTDDFCAMPGIEYKIRNLRKYQ